MENELTTIQISKEASRMLEELAASYKRSKKSHAEWLIERDYEELEKYKLIGEKQNNESKSTK
jgi:predicted transcriptional regulator